MKKHILFMLTLCACALLSGSASGIENNDSMDNSMQAAATIEMQDLDLGPSVADCISAYPVGSAGGSIYLDVYYASNACNAYVAYLAGRTTGAMAVLENADKKIDYKYYVSYQGKSYYFNL